jgi:hypothetical protein
MAPPNTRSSPMQDALEAPAATEAALDCPDSSLGCPPHRMSSWRMTKIAPATSESFCSFFETEVTSAFIRSSRLGLARSPGVCCCPITGAPGLRQPTARIHRVARLATCRLAPAFLFGTVSPDEGCACPPPNPGKTVSEHLLCIQPFILWNPDWEFLRLRTQAVLRRSDSPSRRRFPK